MSIDKKFLNLFIKSTEKAAIGHQNILVKRQDSCRQGGSRSHEERIK